MKDQSGDSSRNNRECQSESSQLYEVPIWNQALGPARGVQTHSEMYEIPHNHHYEYPDQSQSHQYEYPLVITPQTKNGKSDDTTGNKGDGQTEDDYSPLLRAPLNSEREDGEYAPLSNVEKGKEEASVKGIANEPNGLMYVDVIDKEYTSDVRVPLKDVNTTPSCGSLPRNGQKTNEKADIKGSKDGSDKLLYVYVLDDK